MLKKPVASVNGSLPALDPAELAAALPTFPEWSDTDVQAEKWNSKVVFEDPDGSPIFPKSMRGFNFTLKRVGELLQGEGGVPNHLFQISSELSGISSFTCPETGATEILPHVFELNTAIPSTAATAPTLATQQNNNAAPTVPTAPVTMTIMASTITSSTMNSFPSESRLNVSSTPISEGIFSMEPQDMVSEDPAVPQPKLATPDLPKFIQVNRHLWHSPTMRKMMLQLQNAIELYAAGSGGYEGMDEQHPWECIYPKNKDGTTVFSPSGKYFVRLYWMGAWRRITIDDRVPVAEKTGNILLMTGVARNEIWPLLLTKAFLKVSSMSYNDSDKGRECPDFDYITCIKGLLPERLCFPKTLPVTIFNSLQSMFVIDPLTARHSSAKSSVPTETIKPLVLVDNDDSVTITPESISFRISKFTTEDCGTGEMQQYVHLRPSSLKTVPPFSEDPTAEAIPKKLLKQDIRLSIDEFCSSFRNATIYHPHSMHKYVKQLQGGPDMKQSGDTIPKGPLILYLPLLQKPTTLVIGMQATVRVKGSDQSPPKAAACLKIEEYNWMSGAFQLPQMSSYTSGASAFLLQVPAGQHAYKISVQAAGNYHIAFNSNEELTLDEEVKYLADQKLQVKEVEDVYPAQTGPTWTVFFKYELKFMEPTFLSATLLLPEALQPNVYLRAIDNDTNQELPLVLGKLSPRLFVPNKSGYLLMADCRTSGARASGKWKLRLVSDKPLPPVTKNPGEQLILASKIQDFEDFYTPNRHFQVFRHIIKVKEAPMSIASIQVQFSITNVWVSLQLFDHNTLMYSTRGKGIITIPAALLQFVEEPLVAPAVAEKPEKAEKKAAKDKKDKEKEKEKEKEARRESIHALESSKHRYILVAKIESKSHDMITAKMISPSRPTTGKMGSIEPLNSTLSQIKEQPNESSFKASSRKASARKGGETSAARNVSTPAPVEESFTKSTDITMSNVEVPSWKVRIITSDPAIATFTRDTENEDRLNALKASWEAKQPGRGNKARESRRLYLKKSHDGETRKLRLVATPTDEMCYKPWEIIQEALAVLQKPAKHSPPSVLVKEQSSEVRLQSAASSIDTQSTERAESASKYKILGNRVREQQLRGMYDKVSQFEKSYEAFKKERSSNKEYRGKTKEVYLQRFEEKWKEVDGLNKLDQYRKDAYRAKLAKEAKEAKEAEETAAAARAAEIALKAIAEQPTLTLATPEVAEVSEKATKKKGGKK